MHQAPPRMPHQDGSTHHQRSSRNNGGNTASHAPQPVPAAANNNHNTDNNFASVAPQPPMGGFYAPGQGGWPAPPGTMPSFPSFMMPPFGYPGIPPMSFPPPPNGGTAAAPTAPFPGAAQPFPWAPLGPPGGMPFNVPGAPGYPGTQMLPTSTNNAQSLSSPVPPTNTTMNLVGGPRSQTDEAENSNSSADNNATTSGSRTNSGSGGGGRNNNGCGGGNHGGRNSFDLSASNSAVLEQRQLIVKFLTDNTSERQFRALFEQHGPVENARVIYDRKTGHTKGFGFITYAHGADAVKALRSMGGYPLHGRQLNVALVQTERRRAFAAHEFSPE